MKVFSNSLIDSYAEPVEVLIKTGGGWDPETGQYEDPAEEWIEKDAVIVSLSENDLQQIPGGEITADSQKAYTKDKWQIGSQVKVLSKEDSGGNPYIYRIKGKIKDYGYHAEAYVYHLVREGEAV